MTTPVFDPAIPDDDRVVLERMPKALHPAVGLRASARFGGRTGRDALFCLWHAPLWTLLPGLIGPFYGAKAAVAGLAAQGALVGLVLWRPGLLWVVMCLIPLAFGVLLARCGEGRAERLARRYHGRYYLPADLASAKARTLLERAQTAVTAVLDSDVNKEGLLDDVRNKVTLPAQVWDVAQTLYDISRLSEEQRVARAGKINEPISELMKPQQRALELATASVVERIEAIERYAVQVAEADTALAQWRTLQRLTETNDEYQELLARTVRDNLAVAEIDNLTEQAHRVEEALRASVDKARKAGLVLLPGGLAEAS